MRLTAYADAIIMDIENQRKLISVIRFGGHPETINGLAGAILGGAIIEAIQSGAVIQLHSRPKGYQRQLSHDGPYAAAALMASNGMQAMDQVDESEVEKAKKPPQPRKCYIFCPAGDRDRVFEKLDCKTSASLIPEFRDYVPDALIERKELRQWYIPSRNAWMSGS